MRNLALACTNIFVERAASVLAGDGPTYARASWRDASFTEYRELNQRVDEGQGELIPNFSESFFSRIGKRRI
jgi:hypothetical protein